MGFTPKRNRIHPKLQTESGSIPNELAGPSRQISQWSQISKSHGRIHIPRTVTMQILESTWRNVQNTDFTKICIRIHFRSSIFRIWCKPLVLFWNLPVTHVSIKIVRNLLTDCRFQIPAQADSSLDGNLRFGRVLLQADSRFRVPKRGQIAKKVISSRLPPTPPGAPSPQLVQFPPHKD